MNLRQGIARLESLQQKLEDSWPFYQKHIDGWRELARTTAIGVLQATAPDNSDDWQRTIAIAAERVGAALLPVFDVAGVAIFLERTQKTRFENAFNILFSGELSLEEVTLYVAAGRRGDPWGKRDFTEEDRGKEDWQIAENILTSIQRGESRARETLIQAFIDRRLGEELAERMPAILAAWHQVFSRQAMKDWRAWWRS